ATGTVGAGTGARAGALKGGVGTASLKLADGPAAGITVGALIVANPVGDVLDSATGLPWGAGAADLEYHGLRPPSADDRRALAAAKAKSTPLNTTIGVVATDADLDQACTRRIAMAAHDGLARAIVPAHSPLDGDTIFAVATRTCPGQARDALREFTPIGMHPDVAIVTQVSAAAATVTQRAIVNAVLAATGVADIPSLRALLPSALADGPDR
ncbi:P1 family peptidase, partial [Gordonia sp. (in: high G+C Gram-positive bacteria)]|uniref:P1 family peptidase n=1 Tax=Gordonia sp. (in: high G+C Gram-positive bacteria) TaxID=84139 RepID=UPI0039E24154